MLFVGDDWAEDHHDVELMDPAGRRLAKARLPEGIAGIAALHHMIAEHLEDNDTDSDTDDDTVGEVERAASVVVGIETDRGPWVQALIGSGYRVFAVNPLQAARFRERHSVSRAKSDTADAHVLADMVRTDSHQLRPVAGDSPQVEAIKVVARAHKTMIWERTRQGQRLRHALRDYYPAALEAFTDLAAPDTLLLLAKAPDPASGRRLGVAAISAALRHARRRNVAEKATAIQAALRGEQLIQPDVVTAAYAAAVRAQVAILTALTSQIQMLQDQVEAHFGQHRDATIVLSQPGLGVILGARVLAEFGDDTNRYASAKARKNYAATSPITRQSGKKKTVLARHARNDRLADALHHQAFAALSGSAGARAYYDQLRARGVGHPAALRQLGNRLVGILHGCLRDRTLYDENTAWPDRPQPLAA